jgi:hypothetical protein
MGRPRTPSAVLKLRGAFRKNPQRAREDVQVSGDIGEAPVHLSEAQRQVWGEIVSDVPLGVLSNADRIAVEVTAVLLCEFRQNPAEFTAAKYARLQALLGHMGMTPADRSRLGLSAKEAVESSPWDEL